MLVGLLIERVNGWPVEKRLTKDESFTDINYLLECLRQVTSQGVRLPAHAGRPSC